jgi:hypothetical protein
MGKHISTALVLALCACGGGGGSNGGGSVSGTVGGISFPVASAISAIGSNSQGTAAVVAMTSGDDACTQVETNNTHPNETIVELELLDLNETAQTTSAPTAPGTYAVYDTNGSAAPTSTSVAIVFAESAGSDCNGGTGGGNGVSGTVTLTAANATTGVYSGTFDVTFDTGDHVTGSFNPEACTALGESTSGSATCE